MKMKMKQPILLATLVLGTMSFSTFSEAMEVTNVKRKYINVQDSKELKIKEGDFLSIYDDEGGIKVGEARVLKVKGKKAQVYLVDGDVEEGYRLRMKKDDEDDFSSNISDGGSSPFNRGQSISSSSRRSRRAGKSFALESGMIRNIAGIRNIRGHYRLTNGTAIGFGFTDYSVDIETTTTSYYGTSTDVMTISGNSFSLLGTTWFNGTAFSQGAYARGELSYTKLEINDNFGFDSFDVGGIDLTSGASGTEAKASIGYHWQWSNIYTNLYAGLQYYNMSADATATDGTDTATASDSFSGTGFDLGFSLGVAF